VCTWLVSPPSGLLVPLSSILLRSIKQPPIQFLWGGESIGVVVGSCAMARHYKKFTAYKTKKHSHLVDKNMKASEKKQTHLPKRR
jgi:hypothetical protein